jgi:hypothetical protein
MEEQLKIMDSAGNRLFGLKKLATIYCDLEYSFRYYSKKWDQDSITQEN